VVSKKLSDKTFLVYEEGDQMVCAAIALPQGGYATLWGDRNEYGIKWYPSAYIDNNYIEFPTYNLSIAEDFILRYSEDWTYFKFCEGPVRVGLNIAEGRWLQENEYES